MVPHHLLTYSAKNVKNFSIFPLIPGIVCWENFSILLVINVIRYSFPLSIQECPFFVNYLSQLFDHDYCQIKIMIYAFINASAENVQCRSIYWYSLKIAISANIWYLSVYSCNSRQN